MRLADGGFSALGRTKSRCTFIPFLNDLWLSPAFFRSSYLCFSRVARLRVMSIATSLGEQLSYEVGGQLRHRARPPESRPR